MELSTKSAQETKNLGRKIAGNLVTTKNLKDTAIIYALTGDLGSGKTTFVQGFANGLGVEQKVISPTFILVRKYNLNTKLFKNLYHVDLYRLVSNVEREMINLGLDEVIGNNENIVVVEWAEKAREFFPKDTHWIEFSSISEKERKINQR